MEELGIENREQRDRSLLFKRDDVGQLQLLGDNTKNIAELSSRVHHMFSLPECVATPRSTERDENYSIFHTH